jgi:hypothetical protein
MTNAVNLSALGSNGGTSLATWTTGTRPASPITGQTGFNTTLLSLESYNGTAWGSGGGLSIQAVQTTGFTAAKGNIYPCNTTSSSFTVTLPASPTAGDQIVIIDYAGTAATNNILVSPNGNKIQGVTTTGYIVTNRESVYLVFVDSTQGWLSMGTSYTSSNPLPSQYTMTYVTIAGGGGTLSAYNTGGGGAGGMLTGTASIQVGNVYTITVGGGGSAGSPAGSGNNSTITGAGGISITSLGGGSSKTGAGNSGGSGGGGEGNGTNVGGSGTPGQGNAGGTGAGFYGGGGGGGAGAAGGNTIPGVSGTGGNGSATSITGTPATYAGGGSGGNDARYASAGAAGTGGGGQGTASVGGNGTVNTGGGAGGVGYSGSTGGSGGSGRIIISVPTANYSGTTTGSPTVTTNGANTVLTYLSSGTYTS